MTLYNLFLLIKWSQKYWIVFNLAQLSTEASANTSGSGSLVLNVTSCLHTHKHYKTSQNLSDKAVEKWSYDLKIQQIKYFKSLKH